MVLAHGTIKFNLSCDLHVPQHKKHHQSKLHKHITFLRSHFLIITLSGPGDSSYRRPVGISSDWQETNWSAIYKMQGLNTNVSYYWQGKGFELGTLTLQVQFPNNKAIPLTCLKTLCSKILNILQGTVYLFVVLTGTNFHYPLSNPQLNFCLLLHLIKRPEVLHIHEQTEKGFADMNHF